MSWQFRQSSDPGSGLLSCAEWTGVKLTTLLEETGIAIAGRPKRAFRVMTTPGGSTETYELFVANVDSNQAKGLHGLAAENEDIKEVVKRVPALMRMLKAGRIPNGPSALALYWFAVHRAKFRR